MESESKLSKSLTPSEERMETWLKRRVALAKKQRNESNDKIYQAAKGGKIKAYHECLSFLRIKDE